MGRDDLKVIERRIKEGEKAERRAIIQRQRELLRQERIGFWTDFKKFISKGNVLDLAVAVVISTAFNAIVNGLVKYIITPAITYFTSGVSINEWEYILRPEVLDAEGAVVVTKIAIQYGLWLQVVLDFFIIALSVFTAVRIIRKTERRLQAKEIAKKEAEERKRKAEEERRKSEAAEAEAEQKAIAAEEKRREDAEVDEFYANIREMTSLLRTLCENQNKSDS